MEKNYKRIGNWFPSIRQDAGFRITSPTTRRYNCLAWANEWNNKWMWPNEDGHEAEEDEYWPEGVPNNCEIDTFILAFEKLGFVLTDSETQEEGFIKIALYKSDTTGLATHATRQLQNGMWTSKLGFWQDIQHSSPQSIEGYFYGHVYCYMKRIVNRCPPATYI